MIIDTKKGNALPIESNSGILKIYSMLGWYFTDDLLWKLDVKILYEISPILSPIKSILFEFFYSLMTNINSVPLSVRIFITSSCIPDWNTPYHTPFLPLKTWGVEYDVWNTT